MPRVKRLDHIALQVVSPELVCEFYENLWGMSAQNKNKGDIYLSCPPQNHFELLLQRGSENKLGHLSFSVRHDEDIDVFANEAVKKGYTLHRQPGESSEPGQMRSMSVLDPDGNVVELIWCKLPLRNPKREGSPRQLGHVVLWTPNPERTEAFYGWLGFQVSDRTARGMSFLRCNGDHHTVALVKGNKSGLQHIAYDGGHIDNVMQTFGRLRSANIPCIWGPGRHGPGANIFTYYKDPAGNVIELYSDLEKVADSDAPIEAKFWGPEHKGDVWGSAGPVPQEFMG